MSKHQNCLPEFTVEHMNGHSTSNFLKDSEIDIPLNYAEYYFVEALLRFKERSRQIC